MIFIIKNCMGDLIQSLNMEKPEENKKDKNLNEMKGYNMLGDGFEDDGFNIDSMINNLGSDELDTDVLDLDDTISNAINVIDLEDDPVEDKSIETGLNSQMDLGGSNEPSYDIDLTDVRNSMRNGKFGLGQGFKMSESELLDFVENIVESLRGDYKDLKFVDDTCKRFSLKENRSKEIKDIILSENSKKPSVKLYSYVNENFRANSEVKYRFYNVIASYMNYPDSSTLKKESYLIERSQAEGDALNDWTAAVQNYKIINYALSRAKKNDQGMPMVTGEFFEKLYSNRKKYSETIQMLDDDILAKLEASKPKAKYEFVIIDGDKVPLQDLYNEFELWDTTNGNLYKEFRQAYMNLSNKDLAVNDGYDLEEGYMEEKDAPFETPDVDEGMCEECGKDHTKEMLGEEDYFSDDSAVYEDSEQNTWHVDKDGDTYNVYTFDVEDEMGDTVDIEDLKIVNGKFIGDNLDSIPEDIKRKILRDFTESMDEALDKIGKADHDINNDGEIDQQDSYLKKRRKAIKKNMGK